MDRGAWRATVHGVTKSRIGLKRLSTVLTVKYYGIGAEHCQTLGSSPPRPSSCFHPRTLIWVEQRPAWPTASREPGLKELSVRRVYRDCTQQSAIHLPLMSGQSTSFAGGKLMQRGEDLALDVELWKLIFAIGTGSPYSGAWHKFPGESKCYWHLWPYP